MCISSLDSHLCVTSSLFSSGTIAAIHPIKPSFCPHAHYRHHRSPQLFSLKTLLFYFSALSYSLSETLVMTNSVQTPTKRAETTSSTSLSYCPTCSLICVAVASLRAVVVSKESSMQIVDTSSLFLSFLPHLTHISYIFLPGFLASLTMRVRLRPRPNQRAAVGWLPMWAFLLGTPFFFSLFLLVRSLIHLLVSGFTALRIRITRNTSSKSPCFIRSSSCIFLLTTAGEKASLITVLSPLFLC